MSRHIIGDRTKKNRRFIVGYDRPLDCFFLQVWGPRSSAPIRVDYDLDLADLPKYGALVPDGLIDQLAKEVLGQADTNTCKDWRTT